MSEYEACSNATDSGIFVGKAIKILHMEAEVGFLLTHQPVNSHHKELPKM